MTELFVFLFTRKFQRLLVSSTTETSDRSGPTVPDFCLCETTAVVDLSPVVLRQLFPLNPIVRRSVELLTKVHVPSLFPDCRFGPY